MNKENLQPSVPYEQDLYEALTDPEEAIEYLNACLADEDPRIFILALQDVVEAQKLNREYYGIDWQGLYQTLKEQENPALKDIERLLHLVGMKLMVHVA